MDKPLVSVVMGSKSDAPIIDNCIKTLDMLGVNYEVKVLSAHRKPRETALYAQQLNKKGIKVVIAGAGGAAHLPGVIASYTTIPVIGIPIPSSPLQGVDALYSIVQMPKGVPVGCMAVGKAGAVNAAIFAVQILSLEDESFKRKIEEYRRRWSKE